MDVGGWRRWILGRPAEATQELCFVDHLDAERFRLLEFPAGFLAGNDRVGLLAHAPGDAAAGSFDERRGVAARERGQRSGYRLRLSREAAVRRHSRPLGEAESPAPEQLDATLVSRLGT